MGLLKFIGYVASLTLLTTTAAGVQRVAGCRLDTSKVEEPNIRSVIDWYLGLGDSVLDYTVKEVRKSTYFKKTN